MSDRMSLFGVLESQRRFVYLLISVLTAAGIWAAVSLPSAIYPELVFSRITIVVRGSSLGARQMLFSVARPIEEVVSIVPGVTRVQSRAIRGGTETDVTFTETTDMAYALQQVQARVNEIRTDFPAGTAVEIERLTPSLFPILSYNLEGGDPVALYDIARYQIRPLFARVPGVGRVDVQGSAMREVEVIADPARLAAQSLTFDELAASIRAATTVEAVGRMPQDYRQYLIVTANEAHSLDDVANVVVGHGLRVRDVATVKSGTEDQVRMVAGDGQPAALIYITRHVGGNTLEIADSVAAIAANLSKTLPAGVILKPVYDQGSLVRDAVRSVRDAMIIGAVLAVIILLLFLRHARITAISASSIPITMSITALIMSLLGQTFNLMTLGAMAIAIGLVIDDAVVITENIVRHTRLNQHRRIGVRDAVQELIVPVTTSTITTVVVFLPLGLLTGVEGQFFRALSITLTIAVLVSLVVALTIIPLLSERFLRLPETMSADAAGASDAHRGPIAAIGRGIDSLSSRYERALGRSLRHARWIVPVVVVLGTGGVIVQRLVTTGFLPEIDEGAFVLDFTAPGASALTETDRQVHIVERTLMNTPEVTGTSRRLGAELGLFATEQNVGDIVVRLKPERDRDRSTQDVIEEIRTKVAREVPRLRVEFVQILSDVINDLAGAASPVEIKMFGTNIDALEGYARKIEPQMSRIDGVEDYYNGVSEPSAELEMTINQAEVNRFGLSPNDVSSQVAGALLGVQAGEIRLGDRSVAVRVRAPDSVRFQPAQLGAIPVYSATANGNAPLGALATFRPTETRAELLRENQQQLITATADLSGRSLGAVMSDVRAVLAANPPPAGIRVELAGQYAQQQSAFRALLLVLGMAAASVVAVMVIQFESFVEPLVILVAAPLSFVGGIGLLLVTGTPMNVSSFMGLILLIGLVVKNGIILLDFARRRMQGGTLDLADALCDAAVIRLRPILMTTLCALFGLLPLALGIGAGSDMQKPLALAVIGGLALSTPITLFVVPALLVVIRGPDYRMPIGR